MTTPLVRPIAKLLVANRGEIALRVMRTARAQSIATVAVYSDPDAGAPFVRQADESVRLAGATPIETYLDIDQVIAAARASGADAVHPGYGFLSENAAFARACAAAGLVFVGPSPEVIEAMGSKLAAKDLVGAVGVPVLPGAHVASADGARAAAAEIGWPVLVKAAFGGGGRGMRVVASVEEMDEALSSAQREAAGAFGDATVFLERYLVDPRHIEVQIFGDTQGNVVHLFERECSIQRRYQKIIEESPSPAVDETLRAELGTAAITVARTLGYVGAGTVEFVVDGDGHFFFLEVNTRLQVEHPVTEEITGLDLVALQLAVAAGEPLPAEALLPRRTGHAIEARLYAEDVEAGFLPVSGRLFAFEVPAADGIRVDAGVESGSVVSTYYDAMLAKVIATGPTRRLAARRLADALARARIHGLVTNRDLLVGILTSSEFGDGRTDTGFLVRHDPTALVASTLDPRARPLHAAAAALTAQAARRGAAGVQPSLPSGWRNVSDAPQVAVFGDRLGALRVDYRIRPGAADLWVNDQPLDDVTAVEVSTSSVVLAQAGVRWRMDVARHGATVFVDSPLGTAALEEEDRFPLPVIGAAAGSLLAPMPGSVSRVLCLPGDAVSTGQVLVVIEAMKMEHTIVCPHDGIVAEVRVEVGDQVETGAVLAVVVEEDSVESPADRGARGRPPDG